jgi:hypothetical protein
MSAQPQKHQLLATTILHKKPKIPHKNKNTTKPNTSMKVLLPTHGFEMVRIDACPVAAQVVDVEPVRDRFYEHRVGEPVR